ncbi:hypothetical protein BDR22DRAFT_466521 [Usnea florida]
MAEPQAIDMSYLILHSVLLIVFTVTATLAVALRLWARRMQKLPLQTSDYLMILGLIFALAQSFLNLYSCCAPWMKPKNQKELSAAEEYGVLLSFVSPIIWVTAVTIIRSSIITFYAHIFPTRSFRIACIGISVLNASFFVTTVLATCLICHPITYRWDFSLHSGSCGNQQSLDLFIAIFNLFMDITVVALPMPILWGLQMAVSRKIMLSVMFGLGTAICAITLYRIQVTAAIGKPNDPQTNKRYAIIALLTCLEATLGIITGCLLVLKPVYDKFRAPKKVPTVWGGTNRSCTPGSISILLRLSHMWLSMSGKRSGREGWESVDPIEKRDFEWRGE